MKFILLFVSLAISGHVVETIGARLKRASGGTRISIEDAPYVVSLRHKGRHVCGGSLISTEHVLTAAHCVLNEKYGSPPEIRVVSNKDKYDPSDLGHQIEHITLHRGCRVGNVSCDIAVITLLIPVNWDENKHRIELPNAGPRDLDHATFFGFHRYKTENAAASLQEFRVTVHLDRPTSANTDDSDQIFYGPLRQPGQLGNFDLGGPLIRQRKIIGVALKLATYKGRACYFINVAKFKTFIERTMETKRSSNSQRSSVIVRAPKRPRT